MISLARSLNITKTELSRYLSSCYNTTFRIWLAEVRFEAAKRMILEHPDYSNDVISAECGFSSRSYLYRMFKMCIRDRVTVVRLIIKTAKYFLD